MEPKNRTQNSTEPQAGSAICIECLESYLSLFPSHCILEPLNSIKLHQEAWEKSILSNKLTCKLLADVH